MAHEESSQFKMANFFTVQSFVFLKMCTELHSTDPIWIRIHNNTALNFHHPPKTTGYMQLGVQQAICS